MEPRTEPPRDMRLRLMVVPALIRHKLASTYGWTHAESDATPMNQIRDALTLIDAGGKNG